MIADILIKSNVIFDGTEARTREGFVAIKGNRIIGTGTTGEIEEFLSNQTRILDYGDKMILPGFIDSHFHFFMSASFQGRYYVDLASSRSEEDAVALVKAHLEANPDIDHVLGWGWFIMDWTDHKLPSKESLDQNFPDIPIYMFSNDGHTCWMNTKAFDQCGITQNTTVKYGSIGKDGKGELNGLLYENDAESGPMEYAGRMKDEEWQEVEEKMYRYLASCGVTSIADVAAGTVMTEEPDGYKKLMKAKENERLSVRVHLYPSLGDNGDFTLAKELRAKYKYPDLQVSGLKTFVDGTTSMHTGCMLEPYTDKPNEKGFSDYPQELYDTLLTAANKEGFSVKFHAIGDGAVRIVLDAAEKSASVNDMTDIRNCIEHAENIHPSDIPRFAQLGAIASMQIVHLPLDNNEKTERIGKERARYEWPLRSLLDANAVFASGTDYPVFEVNPMIGIYSAITRCLTDGTPVGSSPEEKITLPEILWAYTRDAAYSIGREKDLGTLEKGKLADIVVLDQNLFQLEPSEMLKVKPVMTMMDGNIIFEA